MTSTGAERFESAAEYAAALRTLATMVESLPGIHRYTNITAFFANDREEMVQIVRAALAAGVKVEKDIDEDSYNLDLRIGPLKVSALASRYDVCERVVTGTEEVTKTVVDPAYVLPDAPMIEVKETVEKVKWVCTPLLAEVSAGAAQD
jgi:hypothetical protein